MRRPTLAVFLATVGVAAGVVVVVATGRGDADVPRSSATISATASIVMTTPPPLSRTTIVTAPPPLTVDSGCRTGAGPVRLAPVPAQVTARVDRAWERIETWLGEHAPVTAASLRPPAHDRLIMAAQREVGVQLPPELVASLRRHDGVGGDLRAKFTFPSFWDPLSAEGIVHEATLMCDVLKSLGDNGAVGAWWHGRFVPVATDHGGDLLFLDGARLGLHYEADDVTFDGSYVELLEETADALTGGGEYRPVVVDGALNWV